jgi:hypothetical protein
MAEEEHEDKNKHMRSRELARSQKNCCKVIVTTTF